MNDLCGYCGKPPMKSAWNLGDCKCMVGVGVTDEQLVKYYSPKKTKTKIPKVVTRVIDVVTGKIKTMGVK